MKSLKIFSNLKFEKDGETILINSTGAEVIIELSDQKIFNSLKKISFGESSLYSFSLFAHKNARKLGIKVIIKTPKKTIISLGNTSFYLFKKILLQITILFDR
jgi:hypothetical protein